MILGMLTAKLFGLTGKAKLVTEIAVGALEVGLLITVGAVAYPVEVIAIKAFCISAKTICSKALKKNKIKNQNQKQQNDQKQQQQVDELKSEKQEKETTQTLTE